MQPTPASRATGRVLPHGCSTLTNCSNARARHPAQADAIEEDFRRDSLLAFGAVIARYLAWWGIPCGVAFATGIWLERRRPAPR